MVECLFRSVRACCAFLLLMMMLIYTFSILLHTLMKEQESMNAKLMEELQLDFATLPRSMWTLAMCGSLMFDGAAKIATHLVFDKKIHCVVTGWFFLSFILLAVATFLHLLIGVVVEVVNATSRRRTSLEAVNIASERLKGKLMEFDVSGMGTISQIDLNRFLNDADVKTILRTMQINRFFLLEMQHLLYPRDDSTVAVTLLVEMMLMCRSDGPATVETLATGFCFLVSELRDSHDHGLAQMKQIPPS